MSRDDDDFWEYMMYDETCNNEGVNSSWGCSGEIFKFVVIAVAVIIILALLLGVGIPGAVWGFFAKVILVIGFFTFLGSLGKK